MTKNNIKKIALEVGFDDDEIDKCQLMLERFAHLVAQHEREACLKIAESMSLTDANMNKTWRTGCRDVAEAIRARG